MPEPKKTKRPLNSSLPPRSRDELKCGPRPSIKGGLKKEKAARRHAPSGQENGRGPERHPGLTPNAPAAKEAPHLGSDWGANNKIVTVERKAELEKKLLALL